MNERLQEILYLFSDEEISAEAERRDLGHGLGDFSDAEIEAEYEERLIGRADHDFTRLADAFYLGKTEEALSIAKQMAERATGRNLL